MKLMNASKSSKPLRRKVEDYQLKKSVINKGRGHEVASALGD